MERRIEQGKISSTFSEIPPVLQVTPEVRDQWRQRNKNTRVSDEQIEFLTSGVIAPESVDEMLGIFRSLRSKDEADLRMELQSMELQSKADNGSRPAQQKLELLQKWNSRVSMMDDMRVDEEIALRKVRRNMDLDNPDNRYGRVA